MGRRSVGAFESDCSGVAVDESRAPASIVASESSMATSRKARRQPWNRSTRLNEAPKRSTTSGEEDAEAAAADVATASGALEGSGRPRRIDRATSKRPDARAAMPSDRRRRSISRDGADSAGGQDERERTRAMIERAVSAAFGTVLTDRSSSFERDDVGVSGIGDDYACAEEVGRDLVLDSCRQSHDKENDVRALRDRGMSWSKVCAYRSFVRTADAAASTAQGFDATGHLLQ